MLDSQKKVDFAEVPLVEETSHAPRNSLEFLIQPIVVSELVFKIGGILDTDEVENAHRRNCVKPREKNYLLAWHR